MNIKLVSNALVFLGFATLLFLLILSVYCFINQSYFIGIMLLIAAVLEPVLIFLFRPRFFTKLSREGSDAALRELGSTTYSTDLSSAGSTRFSTDSSRFSTDSFSTIGSGGSTWAYSPEDIGPIELGRERTGKRLSI
jgi:hypothetical protein